MAVTPTGRERPPIAAEAFLRALADHGIDYFFCNPGTDFPPIVEAFSRAKKTNAKVPKPMLVPHENLAVAMAHGAYLMNGRPQAVMVHVNVGTGNTINNLTNLSRDRVPLILAAGAHADHRKGLVRLALAADPLGAGNVRPGRHGARAGEMGLRIARARPDRRRGGARGGSGDGASARAGLSGAAARAAVGAAARADRADQAAPAGGGDASRSERDRHAGRMDRGGRAAADHRRHAAGRRGAGARRISPSAAPFPVVTHNPRSVCLPSSHPMHFGFEPGALLADADLVIVLESDVPWIPSLQHPPAGCRVAHVGEDPFFVRYPMRSFPSDLAVQAGARNALEALTAAVEPRLQMAEARIAARRARLTERMRKRRAQLAKDSAAGATISPEYLSRAIGEAVGEDAIIFNEYPLRADHCAREKPGTLFALGPAGGLGWGFGAALGAKLAAPDAFVVATLGDGAYMFSNPMVGHWVAAKHELPILTIVFNNSRYGAVRRATLSMFKDGAAGENDGRTLADLDPAPPYEEMAQAQGAHAERVEKPADLPDALARARDAVVNERRQALLNVITPY